MSHRIMPRSLLVQSIDGVFLNYYFARLRDRERMIRKMIRDGTFGKFKYILYSPAHLDDMKNLPLIVVMHGSGEIGSSLSKLKKREPYISLNNGKYTPDAYVLMPQLPKNTWGKMAAELKKLIDSIVSVYSCDKTRVSLTGHSLGGMGVIEMLAKYPNDFSAGASLSCAKNYVSELPKIAHIPMWFLHGEKEGNYGKYAREMFATMDSLNEESKLTAVKGYGHPIQFTWCDPKYGIFEWLASFKLGDLVNPTWLSWLNAQRLLDGKGMATDRVDEHIPDDIVKRIGLKKHKV